MKRPRLNTSWLLAALFLIAAAAWLLTGSIATGGRDRAASATVGASAGSEPTLKSVRVARSEAVQRKDIVAVTGHTQASRKVTLKAEAAVLGEPRLVRLPDAVQPGGQRQSGRHEPH